MRMDSEALFFNTKGESKFVGGMSMNALVEKVKKVTLLLFLY